jgi:hypothetical protein
MEARQTQACHWLLLRISGWAADDLMARCRIWLSQGRLRDVARSIAHAAVAQRLRLTEPDLDLLIELLAVDGTDTSALEILDITDLDPMPPFGFAPSRRLARAGRIPAADTRSCCPDSAEPESDGDLAVIRTAADHPPVRAVWRAWRCCGAAIWPPPRRVYVLETEPGADLAAIAARAQEAARRAGERDPQIEVYPGPAGDGPDGPHPDYHEPPSYQRLARDHGALLWARRPDPGIRMLGLIDAADPGSRPPADEVVLDGGERDRLLAYLRGGVPVALTPALGIDAYEPDRPPAVPMNYRTDGLWLWSDASVYYLERYPVVPDPLFTADVRVRGYAYPSVDGATLYRARALLLSS